MAFSAGQQRKAERAVHLLTGLLLLGYVYAPLPDGGQDMIRYVAFPVLVGSGVAMWQAARVRRWRRAATTRRVGHG